MFKIKISLVLAVAACAFSAIATPALAFKEFVAKNAPVQIKGLNVGATVHTFETGGAASVECGRAEATGVATQKSSPTVKISVKYTQCEVKTIFGSNPATVSQAKYFFNANGEVSVENSIEIKVPAAGCVIKVAPQGNQGLKGVTYSNVTGQTNKEVAANAVVTGITQTTTGIESLCGKSSKEGKYKGKETIRAVAGDLEVV